MINKEEAKEKVRKLVEEFSAFSKSQLDGKSESQIQSEFIDPLFEALGWDMRKEVERESRVLKGRADYIFRIGNQESLVVEAKKTNIRLMEDEGRQAVSYAYHRKVKFSVLTNFKYVRVYHALSNIKNIDKNLLFWLEFKDFEKEFEKLWLISKESFESEEIHKLLSKKDEKKFLPVDQSILVDLLEIRELLSKDLKRLRTYLDNEKIDEAIQILIDRLIFMRSVEDRGLENQNFLLGLVKNSREGRLTKKLWYVLDEQFKLFDNVYNSKLFASSILENEKDIFFDDDVLEKVIKILYFGTKDSQYRYMFDEIPGDLLGSIYEQYLGTILRGTEKRVKLEAGTGKRKKMGIYYTPTYIVDYIVKNTVGEYIKDKKIDDILDVRIVDPACGSGSFLIKAFEEVCNVVENKLKNGEKSEKYSSFKTYREKLNLSQKATIMKNCIYGVDLDEKAVELAQLNLLLKILEYEDRGIPNKRLPNLFENIKNGNSLIDDSSVDKKHAFNWNAQFPEIFRDGGFDVVVGNPPYVKARGLEGNKERIFIEKNFESPHKMWDLYVPFIEQGMILLKKYGFFSMIIPDTIGMADYTKKLVEILINKYSVYQIDFFPKIEVFEGVGVRSKIIFVKNSKDLEKCKQVIHENKIDNFRELPLIKNNNPEIFRISDSKVNFNLKQTIYLRNICYVSYGARFNSDKEDPKKFKKKDLISNDKDNIHTHLYTEGKYLSRYNIDKELFIEWGTERSPKRLVRPTFPELYPPTKLLMSRQKGVSTISNNGHICDNTIIVGVPYISLKGVENNSVNKYIKNINLKREEGEENSKNFNLKYILGVLNSKFISYFIKARMRGIIDIYPDDWKEIPIKIPTPEQEQKIISLVDQMLELQKKNHNEDVSGHEKERVGQQIKNIDYEIDQEVYKLYGITPEEQKTIEESLK